MFVQNSLSNQTRTRVPHTNALGYKKRMDYLSVEYRRRRKVSIVFFNVFSIFLRSLIIIGYTCLILKISRNIPNITNRKDFMDKKDICFGKLSSSLDFFYFMKNYL